MRYIYLLLALSCVTISRAQVISVTAAVANGLSDALANDHLVPNPGGELTWDQETCNLPAFIPGLFGNDYGTFCFLHAKEEGTQPKPHKVSTYIGSRAFINGDNTGTIHIKWKNTGTTYAKTDGHQAEVNTTLQVSVGMEVTGIAPGTPVTIMWWYNVFGSGNTSHEDLLLAEDSVFVTNTLSINGDQQFDNNQFDFSSPNGLPGWNQWKNVTGTFEVLAGNMFLVDLTSDIRLYLNIPARAGNFGIDKNNGHYQGEIFFTIIPQYPAQVDNVEDMLTLFSVDIGSDAELSDPKQDGNEFFDPGDLYPKYNGTVLPNVTAWKDDALIFGSDPDPAPGFPVIIAPVGSGMPPDLVRPIYFDLDGSDLVQFDLSSLTYGPGEASIAWFNDSCVYQAGFFYISYDDDGAEHYASFFVPSAPVTSSSPELGIIYSDFSSTDEVNEYAFDDMPPSGHYYEDSIFSETMVHSNLQPDPLIANDLDDDIDALDMIPYDGAVTPCTEWYVSVDHEAAYNHPTIPGPYLDPGAIYQVTPGGPLPVVTTLHHGLPDSTDIDAFEFAWVWDTLQDRYGLALLFSVDDDDSLTLEDESGGLSSQMIYCSFLDGTHGPFVTHELWDDIDAMAIWPHSLNGTAALPNPVWGTKTWTGSKNTHWHHPHNWFPRGVPFDPEDVTVPAAPLLPVISTDGLDCRELNIENGASISILPGINFTIKGP